MPSVAVAMFFFWKLLTALSGRGRKQKLWSAGVHDGLRSLAPAGR
jgi:hypothetical protein